jgi:hypothetical protein
MNKLLVTLALLFAGAAQAQSNCTTLLYTGQLLTSLAVAANYPYPMASPITGTVVLTEPLPLNATDLSVDALWSYSIEGFTSLGNRYRNAVKFTTVNGVITDWDISLYGQDGFATLDSPFYTAFVSTSAGDSVSVALIVNQVIENPPVFLGSNTTRGSWACQPVDPLAAQLAAAQATITSLRTQLAGITAERDQYEALFRVADQEIAILEKAK